MNFNENINAKVVIILKTNNYLGTFFRIIIKNRFIFEAFDWDKRHSGHRMQALRFVTMNIYARKFWKYNFFNVSLRRRNMLHL